MPGKRKARIDWTPEEKILIVSRAVDLMAGKPGLAGLHLLREAVEALPPNRRRSLVATSQAAWFNRAVAAEVERRGWEVKVKSAELKETQDLEAKELAAEARDYRREVLYLLEEIRRELSALNGRTPATAKGSSTRRNGRRL